MFSEQVDKNVGPIKHIVLDFDQTMTMAHTWPRANAY